MPDTVELWGFGDVDRSGKVRWVAAELGLPVEEHRVGFGAHREAEYRAMNPLAQIPTVRYRGQVLRESTAICQLLAESVAEPRLWVGPGEPQRDRYLYWLAVFGETLEGRLVETAVSKRGILPPEYAALHERTLRFKLKVVASELPADGYLCGDAFTVADVLAGYALRLGVQCELVAMDAVQGYLDRLRARPAAIQSRVFASLAA